MQGSTITDYLNIVAAKGKTSLLLGVGISALALSTGLYAPAFAQESDESETDEEILAEDDDVIVVTGTAGTNISGVKPVGSAAVVIDEDAIRETGKGNVADVVRTLPQLQKLGFDGELAGGDNSGAGGGGNANRGTALNLRGIGQNATLLLVDGKRIAPSGTATAFSEAIQVPLPAVQRIEVITDGASAIYGSDAIAGVVNYVLRKDYEGFEVTGRYNTNEYSSDWAAGFTAGKGWDLGMGAGNIVLTYERSEQESLARGDVPYFRQDLTSFGGADNRINGNVSTPGNPGNIVVGPNFGQPGPVDPNLPEANGYLYYGIPSDYGAELTADELMAQQPNLVDRADYEYLLPEVTRDQVTLFLRQELAPGIELYNETFYTKRETVTQTFLANNTSSSSFTVTVDPGDPFYIDGIPGTNGGSYDVHYNLAEHVWPNGPRFLNENPEESLSTTTGMTFDLSGDWEGEVYATYGENETCGICYIGNVINGDADSAFNAAVDGGVIDPYSSEPLTDSQLSLILGTNYQYAQNYFTDFVAKANGSLFEIPGGQVKAAFGVEYSTLDNRLQNAANRGTANEFIPDADSQRTRTQYAGFGELYLPLVSDSMDVPLMQEFIVSAAARYDYYSDFGQTTNPKVGFTWATGDSLSLRGSWGTSFRAPGLPELEPGLFSVAVQIPTFPDNSGRTDIDGYELFPGSGKFTNLLFRLGANPDLEAEQGETWSAGLDFTPTALDGFTASMTYYSIEYTDKLIGPNWGSYLSNPENAALYDPYIIPIDNPAGCVAGDTSTYDPALVPFVTNYLYGGETISDPCGIEVVLDGRFQNAAQAFQDGLDFSANYAFDTDLGNFTIGGNLTKILTNEETQIEGAEAGDLLDRIYFPVSTRARGNFGFHRGLFDANLAVNYVGEYTNDAPITLNNIVQPVSEVDAWTTYDLSLSWNFYDEKWGMADGTRLGLTIQNITDEDPPIVLSGQTAADTRNHSPFGRIVQLTMTKSF